MSAAVRGLVAAGLCLLVVGCSSTPTQTTVTETVLVTAGPDDGGSTETPTAGSELRTAVERAVTDSGLDLSSDICDDWHERREETLATMVGTVVERLDATARQDEAEAERVAAEVIRDRADMQCQALSGSSGSDAADATATASADAPEAPKSETEGWDVANGDWFATVTACPSDRRGDPVATVQVLNNGSTEVDLVGVVEVIDLDSDRRVGEISFRATRVGPGQLVSTQASGLRGVPDNYFCSALTVQPGG